MLRDSTVVVVVRTRPRAIPLAMIHMRKSIHGFPFVPLYGYGAPLGGLRPPSSAIKYKKLQLLFSIFLNPEAPLCLKDKFSFVSANSAHMTRGAASRNLVVPQSRTNSSKCMFSFSAAILFNALPLDIKQLVRIPIVSPNVLISSSAFF